MCLSVLGGGDKRNSGTCSGSEGAHGCGQAGATAKPHTGALRRAQGGGKGAAPACRVHRDGQLWVGHQSSRIDEVWLYGSASRNQALAQASKAGERSTSANLQPRTGGLYGGTYSKGVSLPSMISHYIL